MFISRFIPKFIIRVVKSRIFKYFCIFILTLAAIIASIAATLYYVRSLYPYKETKFVRLTVAQKLATETRYQTHVSTDKHIYRPNDVVLFQAILLGIFDHKTVTYDDCEELVLHKNTIIEVIGPSGIPVFSNSLYWTKLQCNLSSIESSWKIPHDTVGGEYTLKISYAKSWWRSAGERKFQIREYLPAQLYSYIEFDKKEYGPRDAVVATLEVGREQGGIPEDAVVEITATLNHEKFVSDTYLELDSTGKTIVKFQLPDFTLASQALLICKVTDGGVVETFSKSIPVAFNQIEIEFFPEGGEIVEGVSNTIYFQTSFPDNSPANISGVLCKIKGEECITILDVRTKHEGRGKFAFSHTVGTKYAIKIDHPAGISKLYSLPNPNTHDITQVALSVPNPVLRAGDVLHASIFARRRLYGLRGVLTKDDRVLLEKNFPPMIPDSISPIVLWLPLNYSGVYTLTLLHHALPIAERRIFILPQDKINFEVTTINNNGSLKYKPGQNVKLQVVPKDKNGNPISSVFSIKVVDKSVLRKVEPRERHPRLIDMALLENEVQSFFDAGSYFGTENWENIDLLLGVQGWSRFIYYGNITAFIRKYDQIALRFLAADTDVLLTQYAKIPIRFNRFLNSILSRLDKKETPRRYIPTPEEKKEMEKQRWQREQDKREEKERREHARKHHVDKSAEEAGTLEEQQRDEIREIFDQFVKYENDPSNFDLFFFGKNVKVYRESAKKKGLKKPPKLRDEGRKNFEVLLHQCAVQAKQDDNVKTFEFTLSDIYTSLDVMIDGFSMLEADEPMLFGEATLEILSVKS